MKQIIAVAVRHGRTICSFEDSIKGAIKTMSKWQRDEHAAPVAVHIGFDSEFIGERVVDERKTKAAITAFEWAHPAWKTHSPMTAEAMRTWQAFCREFGDIEMDWHLDLGI